MSQNSLSRPLGAPMCAQSGPSVTFLQQQPTWWCAALKATGSMHWSSWKNTGLFQRPNMCATKRTATITFYTPQNLSVQQAVERFSLVPADLKQKGIKRLVETALGEWTSNEELPDGEIFVDGSCATEATLVGLPEIPECQIEDPDPQPSDFEYLNGEVPG